MVYYGFTQLDAIMQMWAGYGVFSVLLPTIIIFAVVYAILQKSKILGAKHAIDGIVAIAIAIIATGTSDFMPKFFSELFPRVGMGIAILVSIAILFGLFFVADIPGQERLWRVMGGMAAFIIFIVILINTAGGQPLAGGRTFWEANKQVIIAGVVIVAIIAFITMSHEWTQPGEPKKA